MKDALGETIAQTLYHIMKVMRKQSECKVDHSLTLHHIEVLHIVIDQRYPMHTIAQKLAITMPSATTLIDRMEKAGLVRREQDTHDRRQVCIAITDKGRKTLDKYRDMKQRRIQYILEKLSAKDKQDLLRILQTLSAQLEKEQI